MSKAEETTADGGSIGTTPEDKMQWLRDRGVTIETAEDRQRNKISHASSSSSMSKVKVVHVPWDTSKPLEEIDVAIPRRSPSDDNDNNDNGDQLLEALRPAFATGDVDVSLLNSHSSGTGTTLSSNTDLPPPSHQTLRDVAASGCIETFSLTQPRPSSSSSNDNKRTLPAYRSEKIYLDEVGLLKRLPLNARASQLAARAGFSPPPNFYGDVFVGRTLHRPVVTNVDFGLSDMSPSAEWLVHAATDNYESQKELRELATTTTEQPSNAGEDGIAQHCDGYRWTQTDEEVEIVVACRNRHHSPKVKFTSTYVLVTNHNDNNNVDKDNNKDWLRIDLFARIDPDGCTWTMESSNEEGPLLIISCEKREAISWPRITF